MAGIEPERMSPEEVASNLGVNFEAENERRYIEEWRCMSEAERGEELRQCLLLADAIGYEPDMTPEPKLPPMRQRVKVQ